MSSIDFVNFKEIVDLKNGLNFSKSDRGGMLKIIGVGDFKRYITIDFDNLETIYPPKKLNPEYMLQNGDLLFVRSNGNKELIGRCLLIQNVDEPISHSGFTIRARLTTNAIFPELIAEYFACGLAHRFIQRRGGGTNISNLSQAILEDLPIPFLEKSEQVKVIELASQFNEAITLTEKLIRAKRRLKQGLMQKVFFTRKDTTWQVYKLGNLFERVVRKNNVGCELVVTGSGEHGLIDQREYFNRRVASSDLRGYYLIKRGEFAYNRSSMKGYPYGAIKRLDRYDAATLSTLYVCFKLIRDDFNSDFFLYLFESGILNREIYGIVHEGARAHGLLNLSIQNFFGIKISVPSVELQNKVANLFRVIDCEIDLQTQYLKALQRQKRGVMQKLLTGAIRIPVLDDAA